jgi:hypothetical protein
MLVGISYLIPTGPANQDNTGFAEGPNLVTGADGLGKATTPPRASTSCPGEQRLGSTPTAPSDSPEKESLVIRCEMKVSGVSEDWCGSFSTPSFHILTSQSTQDSFSSFSGGSSARSLRHFDGCIASVANCRLVVSQPFFSNQEIEAGEAPMIGWQSHVKSVQWGAHE